MPHCPKIFWPRAPSTAWIDFVEFSSGSAQAFTERPPDFLVLLSIHGKWAERLQPGHRMLSLCLLTESSTA
jgi:hypothetical protein